eukprot:1150315-Pelagomonas_calceolata.AAC.2
MGLKRKIPDGIREDASLPAMTSACLMVDKKQVLHSLQHCSFASHSKLQICICSLTPLPIQ